MIEPRFRWRFPEQAVTPSVVVEAAARHGVGERVAGLLARRGLSDGAAVDSFYADPTAVLHDPSLLPDAAAARDRIALARRRGERVIVFGDFDADGLTGLAILVLALRRLGIDAQPYVPSRLDEGHGLSRAAIATATSVGATLLVTVDCGTTSLAEIGEARAAGVDVIVTDHHRVPPELPPAVAIVNPQRADSRYPERRLAGSGVAFKLAQLLLADEPGGPAAALELADLATIGSIADLVPILGETRAIVRLGLDRLRAAPRPGLAALLAGAGWTGPGSAAGAIDVETIAFAIAPRINAAGRVGEAMTAARLLLAADGDEATALAAELEASNLTRRDLTKQTIDEARSALAAGTAPDEALTIVHGPWSVGIVGLVASRLVDELGRPAIVGADLGDVIRASCRSNGRLDLGAALEGCSDLFIRHGGHAGAAGFEIPTERWPELVERLGGLARAVAPPDPRAELAIDLVLPALDIDYALHRDLARLAPCGIGNVEPLIAVVGLTATRVRSASGGHSQLTLKRRLDVLDGIAFGRPDLAEVVREGDRVDVVARLVSRRFGGFESLQLDIRDVATSAMHPEIAAIVGGSAAGGEAPALPPALVPVNGG